MTSTSRVHAYQLCTTGVIQRSDKYIYVCQLIARLCFAKRQHRSAERAIRQALPRIISSTLLTVAA